MARAGSAANAARLGAFDVCAAFCSAPPARERRAVGPDFQRHVHELLQSRHWHRGRHGARGDRARRGPRPQRLLRAPADLTGAARRSASAGCEEHRFPVAARHEWRGRLVFFEPSCLSAVTGGCTGAASEAKPQQRGPGSSPKPACFSKISSNSAESADLSAYAQAQPASCCTDTATRRPWALLGPVEGAVGPNPRLVGRRARRRLLRHGRIVSGDIEDYFEVSRTIAERRLLPAIRSQRPGTKGRRGIRRLVPTPDSSI